MNDHTFKIKFKNEGMDGAGMCMRPETFQSNTKSSCKVSVSDEKHTAPRTHYQWTLGEKLTLLMTNLKIFNHHKTFLPDSQYTQQYLHSQRAETHSYNYTPRE